MNTLAKIFKALADESRLRILNLILRTGEICVCDIESIMAVTQTKVSRHLAYLRSAGLVKDRRQGLWMLYSIADPADEEHRQILSLLKSILSKNEVATLDAKTLASNIKKGCCTSVTVMKPQSVSLHVSNN